MSRSWAGGSTRHWREVVRPYVLQRDGYRCRAHDGGWCATAGAGDHECTGRAELSGPHAGHAHHVLGRAVSGDDPLYIVAACRACNLAIGDPSRAGDPLPQPRTRW